MKNKISKRFFAASLIYFIIALFFLILHFFQLERFSGTRGDIHYIGMSTKETRISPSRIRKIKLYFNGMELFVNPLNHIKVITGDGIAHPLNIESLTFRDNGLDMRFNHDVSIRFTSDMHSKKVTMQPELPLTIPPMERLHIPMNWMDGFTLVKEDDLYKLQGDSEEVYYMTVPPNTEFTQDAEMIDLDISNNILREIVLEETLTGSGRTLTDWYEKEGQKDLISVYERELSLFRNKIFLSLRERMDNKGNLLNPSGESYFSETAINVLLSESLERNVYNSLQEELALGTTDNRSRLSYQSAPYLGDIVTQGSSMLSSDWRLQTQIRDGLNKENFPFFEYQDLYTFFQTQSGLKSELDKIESLARTPLKEREDDYLYQLNRMKFLLNLERNQSDQERISYIEKQLEQYFLSNLFWIKDDLLIFDQQGIAQLESSLFLGALLLENADLFNDPQLATAGRKIVLSVLKHADDQGFLPESLIFSSNGESEQQGQLLPERIYEILWPSNYRPRRIDLSKTLGQGSWIYTAAPRFNISSTPRETIANVQFPIGSAHHMVIRGVKPFKSIYLHGIKWKSARDFQRYSDGWVYDAQRQVLYIKIQHQREMEAIQIRYYEDNPVPSAADNDTEE